MEVLLIWNRLQHQRSWSAGQASCQGPLTSLVIIAWLCAKAILWVPEWRRINEDADTKANWHQLIINKFYCVIGKRGREHYNLFDVDIILCFVLKLPWTHFLVFLLYYLMSYYFLSPCSCSDFPHRNVDKQLCSHKRMVKLNETDLWCWFLQTTWRSRPAQPAWLSSGDCWSLLWRHETSPGSPQTPLGCSSLVFSCVPS